MASYSCLSAIMIGNSMWKAITDIKHESQESIDAAGCILYRNALSLAAQTFTPSVPHLLDKIELFFSKTGYGQAIYTVSIVTTIAGVPTSAILATGHVISESISIPVWITVTLDNKINLDAGVTYAIVVTAEGYIWDYLCWNGAINNEYVGGTSYKYVNGVWSHDEALASDFAFREYESSVTMARATKSIIRQSSLKLFISLTAIKARRQIVSMVKIGVSSLLTWQSICYKIITDLISINETIFVKAYLVPIEESVVMSDSVLSGKNIPNFWLEIRDGTGQLLSVLENAFDITISEKLTEIPMVTFSLPAGDSKAAYLIPTNWIWVHQKNMPVKVFQIYKDGNKR